MMCSITYVDAKKIQISRNKQGMRNKYICKCKLNSSQCNRDIINLDCNAFKAFTYVLNVIIISTISKETNAHIVTTFTMLNVPIVTITN